MSGRQHALVVAVHPTGDTGLVVELLTETSGKLACLARSARRSRQRFPGGLDALTLVRAETSPPTRGELHELKESTLVDGFPGLRTDSLALGRAAYIAELASALTPRDHATPGTFELVTASLAALSDGPAGAGMLRWAEMKLLMLAGELAPLHTCSECGKALETAGWSVPGTLGHLLCADCSGGHGHRLGRGAVELLRDCATWNAVQARDAKVPETASMEVGRWLQPLVKQAAGRSLKSARFLSQIQKQHQPG